MTSGSSGHPVDELGADFFDRAASVIAHRRPAQVGPLPLDLAGPTVSDLDHIAGHVRASTVTSWPPLEVISVDAGTVPATAIPVQMRSGGRETLIARGERYTAVGNGDEGSFWVFDQERARAVRWVRDVHRLPYGDEVSPLSLAIRWWAATQRLGALVHTGAVAGPGGAVLLVGNSGAGKSTSVMSCVDSDLEVLGDDQAIVDVVSDGAVVHPVYRLAKLVPDSLDLLPSLRERVVAHGRYGKSLLSLHGRALPPSPVRAICLVDRRPGGPTRVETCSRAEVLRAVGVSTLFQLSVAKDHTWDVTTALMRSAPSFRLIVDRPNGVAPVLLELIRRMGHAA